MCKYFEENDELFEGLLEFLNSLPQAKVKAINMEKYYKMAKSTSQLKGLLEKNLSDGQIDISINNLFNLGSISVEIDCLLVEDMKLFSEIIVNADNFEIYPLTNGKIQLDITFQGVLKSIC